MASVPAWITLREIAKLLQQISLSAFYSKYGTRIGKFLKHSVSKQASYDNRSLHTVGFSHFRSHALVFEGGRQYKSYGVWGYQSVWVVKRVVMRVYTFVSLQDDVLIRIAYSAVAWRSLLLYMEPWKNGLYYKQKYFKLRSGDWKRVYKWCVKKDLKRMSFVRKRPAQHGPPWSTELFHIWIPSSWYRIYAWRSTMYIVRVSL